MKYLKKYNESKSPLNSLSDEELEERLKWLAIEYKEIGDEMATIRTLLRGRKEEREEIHSKNLPDNVFDLNKEQFDWTFEHHHGTTPKRYEISQKYINQLKGVISSGFKRDTGQFYFDIFTSESFNSKEDGFELKPDVIKSIKFLGDNLKRVNDFVEFGVLFYFDDNYNEKVRYYSDGHLEYGSYRHFTRVNSIEDLLKRLVDNDIMNRNNDDNW